MTKTLHVYTFLTFAVYISRKLGYPLVTVTFFLGLAAPKSFNETSKSGINTTDLIVVRSISSAVTKMSKMKMKYLLQLNAYSISHWFCKPSKIIKMSNINRIIG
jgi:hypothetical protein